jgi:hypothetical protein
MFRRQIAGLPLLCFKTTFFQWTGSDHIVIVGKRCRIIKPGGDNTGIVKELGDC